MGKFKVGDRVRSIEGDKEYIGAIGTIIKDDGSFVPYKVKLDKPIERYGDTVIWRSVSGLELVEHTWQPKVGDRVRYRDNCVSGGGIVTAPVENSSKYDDGDSFDWYVEVESKDGSFAYYLGEKARMFKTSALSPLPVAVQPAALVIQAGKFYKTRDGRKVGPIIPETRGWFADQYVWGDSNNAWTAKGEHLDGLQSEQDLIAEWVDEPAVASNDNAAPAKFKVGDRVRINHTDYPDDVQVGEILKVIKVDDEGFYPLSKDGLDYLYFYNHEGYFVSSASTAIVARIENGQPKPAPRPYVHASEAAAAKEASRLASIHKGQQFGVYVLTTTSQEEAPSYKHEWQRLAAKGEKIAAIKELRSITGLGLKATKDAVEHWIANDEPYSRIAA